MDELTPKAARLLAAARQQHEPSESDSVRVRTALAAALLVPVKPGLHAPADALSQPPLAGGLLSSTLSKLLLVSTFLGGAAVWGYLALAPRAEPSLRTRSAREVSAHEVAELAPAPHSQSAQTRAAAPAAIAATSARQAPTASAGEGVSAAASLEVAASTRPEAHSAAAARARVRRTRAGAAANSGEPSASAAASDPATKAATEPSTQSDANGELTLMRTALARLNAGDARAALAALELHAARYPDGVMREERTGLRAIALCESGDLAAGGVARANFLAAASHSPLTARVRNACTASAR